MNAQLTQALKKSCYSNRKTITVKRIVKQATRNLTNPPPIRCCICLNNIARGIRCGVCVEFTCRPCGIEWQRTSVDKIPLQERVHQHYDYFCPVCQQQSPQRAVQHTRYQVMRGGIETGTYIINTPSARNFTTLDYQQACPVEIVDVEKEELISPYKQRMDELIEEGTQLDIKQHRNDEKRTTHQKIIDDHHHRIAVLDDEQRRAGEEKLRLYQSIQDETQIIWQCNSAGKVIKKEIEDHENEVFRTVGYDTNSEYDGGSELDIKSHLSDDSNGLDNWNIYGKVIPSESLGVKMNFNPPQEPITAPSTNERPREEVKEEESLQDYNLRQFQDRELREFTQVPLTRTVLAIFNNRPLNNEIIRVTVGELRSQVAAQRLTTAQLEASEELAPALIRDAASQNSVASRTRAAGNKRQRRE